MKIEVIIVVLASLLALLIPTALSIENELLVVTNVFPERFESGKSQALNIEPTRVTIKATTTNGLGFIGREEGMAAQAVALVQSKVEGV